MQRLLTACAVGILGLAALAAAVIALASKGPAVLASAPAELWQSAVAMIDPPASARPAIPARATVIAQGILARTVAHDEATNLYVTTPASPNRVFALPAPLPSTAHGAADSAELAAAAPELVPFAGSGQKGSLGDSGTALLAQFDLKTDSIVMRSGIVVAADGTVFIADTLNGTIRRITSPNRSTEPGIVSAVAGRWATAESAQLIEPVGIALDRAGNLYIADHTAGAVYLVRSATSTTPGGIELFAHVVAPGNIAATPDGSRVFVASPDTGKLFSIATKSHVIKSIAGFELPGARAALSSARLGGSYCGLTAQTAPEACPTGLAADGEGNLFIADATLGQIFRLDAKTGASTLAAKGLSAPGDISFDVAGDLFVADQGSERIFRFNSMGAPLSVLSITAPAPLPPPTAPEVCTPLLIQPEAYTFCNDPVGAASGPQSFTVTNNSAATVNSLAWSISPLMTPSNFTIQGSTCTASLGPGLSCTINVAFTPQQSGEVDATLTVTDVAGDTADSEVGGTGTDYQLALAAGQTMVMSVQQGGGVSYNLQLIPDPIFSENVTFVCPPPATIRQQLNGFVPPYTTCTITPASAVVSPSTPVNFTIAFQTTYDYLPPTATSVPGSFWNAPRDPRGPVEPALGAAPRVILFPALALIGLAAIFYFSRRTGAVRSAWIGPRSRLATASLAALMAGIALLGACHKNYVNPAIETTPAGSTDMTVTATANGASRGVVITLDVVKKVPVLPGDVPRGAH